MQEASRKKKLANASFEAFTPVQQHCTVSQPRRPRLERNCQLHGI